MKYCHKLPPAVVYVGDVSVLCTKADGGTLCVVAGWAHVVCALYIPEVEFANVSTMEPIVLQSVPHERYNKVTNTFTGLDNDI